MGNPLVGLGYNVGASLLGGANSNTLLGRAKWVRCDSSGPDLTVLAPSTIKTQIDHYRGLGFKTCVMISQTVGSADVVAYVREVAALAEPDALEIYNEPDIDLDPGEGTTIVDPLVHTTDLNYIRTRALTHLSNRPFLLGPSMAHWDMRATWASRIFWDAFHGANGHQQMDGISMHPYFLFNADPASVIADIATWSTDIKSRCPGRSLTWTEFALSEAEVVRLSGTAYSVSNHGTLLASAVTTGLANADGFCVYDAQDNGNAFQSLVDSEGAPTALLDALNSALATAGVTGVGGA
jgi:hypothetical protein